MVRVRGTIDPARSGSVLRGDPVSGSMHLASHFRIPAAVLSHYWRFCRPHSFDTALLRYEGTGRQYSKTVVVLYS